MFLFATKQYGADDNGKKNQSKSVRIKRKRKTTRKDNYIFILFGYETCKAHRNTATLAKKNP